MEHRQSAHRGSISIECPNHECFERDVRHKGVLCHMPDAREVPVSPFFHQIDQLGVYHSICRICFHTVAQDPRESKLFEGEEEHQCEGSPRNPAN